jgi:hypothetical protein
MRSHFKQLGGFLQQAQGLGFSFLPEKGYELFFSGFLRFSADTKST